MASRARTSYTYSRCFSGGDGANLGDPFQNSITSLIFLIKLVDTGRVTSICGKTWSPISFITSPGQSWIPH